MRALNVKKLGGSGGMPARKNFKIRYSEIASEALFGPNNAETVQASLCSCTEACSVVVVHIKNMGLAGAQQGRRQLF